MADPLTNTQFALGLFQPVVNSIKEINSQRIALAQREAEQKRSDSIMFWKRQQDLYDDQQKATLQERLTDKQITATLQGQKEQTSRIIEEQRLSAQRQLEAEVRKLYSNYTALTDEEKRKPLAEFGKDAASQYEELSRVVGEMANRVQMDASVRKLYEDYGALGGKEPVDKFGKTDAQQIQGLSREIGSLKSGRAKSAYINLGREVGKVTDEIHEAEKLTAEEIQQAKNNGLRELSPKARQALAVARAAGLSEEGALAKIAKVFPEDVDAYKTAINQAIVGLRINKRDSDKTLRELYDRATVMQQMRARAAINLMDIEPDALIEPAPKQTALIAPPEAGRVTEDDLRKTTLNRPPKPVIGVPSPPETRAMPQVRYDLPAEVVETRPAAQIRYEIPPQATAPVRSVSAPTQRGAVSSFLRTENDALLNHLKNLEVKRAAEQAARQQAQQNWLDQQLIIRQQQQEAGRAFRGGGG